MESGGGVFGAHAREVEDPQRQTGEGNRLAPKRTVLLLLIILILKQINKKAKDKANDEKSPDSSAGADCVR